MCLSCSSNCSQLQSSSIYIYVEHPTCTPCLYNIIYIMLNVLHIIFKNYYNNYISYIIYNTLHISVCPPEYAYICAETNIAAIAGGVVAGVVVLCIVIAIWACVCVCCCCCYKKRVKKKTAISPASESTVSQETSPAEQQTTKPPQYNPVYDPTLKGAYTSAPSPPASTEPTAPQPPSTHPELGGAQPADYPSQPMDLPPPYPGTPPSNEP